MIVRTRKYRIPSELYIKLGMQNILRIQWWVSPLLVLLMSGSFFVKTIWFVVVAVIALVCYLLFWLIQFYGLTQLEENRPMFERIVYEMNNQHLIMQINTKQGMAIPWADITKAYKKKAYFLLVRSKMQFFYLPFKIFHGDNEIKLLTAMLQRKGLLK